LSSKAKGLRFARTVGEVGEQLRRFRGQPGDDLYAHMRRLEWLSKNSGSLKRKLDLRDGFRIYQLLVTETLVPMAFVKGLPIPPETVASANRLRAAIERRPLPGEIPYEGFRDGGPDKPARAIGVAACDDLADFASHRDFLLGSQERHIFRTLPGPPGSNSSGCWKSDV